ncbi:hypothetical protein CEXT_639661 [Caerostris extrusa]|uniref:Uncharacterized protein n=1 Tax=Caerostris extrusa TaxID=172846 RepID=A0AAV4MCM1_CAEEX|nr:hypothetical protein CEXT_639661 [Caerostris extrusa]
MEMLLKSKKILQGVDMSLLQCILPGKRVCASNMRKSKASIPLPEKQNKRCDYPNHRGCTSRPITLSTPHLVISECKRGTTCCCQPDNNERKKRTTFF